MGLSDGETRSHLQLLADQVTSESLESTRRSVAMCERSWDAGVTSLVALHRQADQLDGMEQGMRQIHVDVQTASGHLAEMRRCCGLCPLPCWRASLFEDGQEWKKDADGKVVERQPQRLQRPPVASGYISRLTDDEREDEMEANLQKIDRIVRNMYDMANDIGYEVDAQNAQVTVIADMATSNEGRIEDATHQTGKILKSQ